MEKLNLTSGCIVLIDAFDEIPEHSFLVDNVYDDCITGVAQSGPLAGEYGEPDLALIVRVLSISS